MLGNQDEAARELLDDTEGAAVERVSSRGKALPPIAALPVPVVLGLGLYLHWGASDKVALVEQFAQAPKSVEK